MNSLNKNNTSLQKNTEPVDGKMVEHFKNRIKDLHFEDDRSQKLANHFFSNKFSAKNTEYFRKRQRFSMKDLIRYIEAGKNTGLIKLPTGAGKTFLFGNIIQALDTPSIILVPRENLVNGTYDELVGSETKSGIGFTKENTFKLYGKEKGNTVEQAEAIAGTGDFNGTLIMTYQSFVGLLKQDTALFNKLVKNLGCIISDEAHRSLGDQTESTMESAKDMIDEEGENDTIDIDSEIEAENQIEKILQKKKLLHIYTTATPRLSNKEVEQDIISSATTGEVIDDGDLILPSQKKLGNAITEIEGDKIRAQDNSQPLDKFIFEDGQLVYEKLTNEYKNAKKLNGEYLPTVAFCNTTDQVEFYVKYLLSQGIKAIQCTTNTSGTNYKTTEQSEDLLEKGEADVIVTCSKVGEGWDLPTLRGAIWLVPSSSPARIMQGTGRIMRILKEDDIERITHTSGLDRKYIEKTQENTLLFTPEVWKYTSAGNTGIGLGEENDDEEGKDESEGGSNERHNTLGEVYTGLNLYGVYGELSPEQLMAAEIDFSYDQIKFRENYTVQELIDMNIPEEVLGDNKKYRLYAIEKNKENSDKKLPMALKGLANILGCAQKKDELMKALEVQVSSQYTIQELIDMNIPEEVLGADRKWRPYALEKNKENPSKKLPMTLGGLANILGCAQKKDELMKALEVQVSSQYTIQELIDMNIPEEVLGADRKWRPYAIEKNKENPSKKLPMALKGLANILGCVAKKDELMKALGMQVSSQYTVQELIDMNIPEEVLGEHKYWRPYAIEKNKENPSKKLPITPGGLANILGCAQKKDELMKALEMQVFSQYTVQELIDMNIPEEVLGTTKKWRAYAIEKNKENPDKKLALTLGWLARLLECGTKKNELMQALEMKVYSEYTVQELIDMNIPEGVLGAYKKWRPYALEKNKENPSKKLPMTLKGLANILGCAQKKDELMQALGIKKK